MQKIISLFGMIILWAICIIFLGIYKTPFLIFANICLIIIICVIANFIIEEKDDKT